MRSLSACFSVLLLLSSQLGCGDDAGARAPDRTDGRPAGSGGALGGGGALGSGGAVGRDGGSAVSGDGGGDGGAAIEPSLDGAKPFLDDGSAGTGDTSTGSGGGGGAFGPDGGVTGLDVATEVVVDAVGGARDASMDVPMGTDGGSAGLDAPGNSPDYIIIAADGLAASAKRYRDFRRATGFTVELAMVGDIVGSSADAAAATARMRDYVRSLYMGRDHARPVYLLLLGDSQPTWPGDRSGVPAGVWQSAAGELVVSDNVYADVDGDDIPDLAVGRITADSDAEADAVRAKVEAYEANHVPGEWNRRLGIFASTSGMGDLIDTIIETIVYDITEAIPYEFDVSMTYARQISAYVYVPEQFSDQVYRRINEGSLLTAYVGHGSRDGFAQLDWSGKTYPILDTDRLEKLAVTHRSPILVFVACTTGDFVDGESVSERILVQKEAPVAILSSTEISDPYANAVFIYEVSQAFTNVRAARVGDAFLLAKQHMLGNDDEVRRRIDALAALLVSGSARDALKHSHLHMYTLFGDPAMAVTYPERAQVVAATALQPVAASTVNAGMELFVTTTIPAPANAAEVVVTLESQRKVILGQIAPVPADGDPNRDAVITSNYQIANDKVAGRATISATGTSFTARLTVPANLPPGQYHIKAFVRDSGGDYAGTLPITVN